MNIFDRAATRVARLTGHPAVFMLACLIIVIMVFLIQNTQNRESWA